MKTVAFLCVLMHWIQSSVLVATVMDSEVMVETSREAGVNTLTVRVQGKHNFIHEIESSVRRYYPKDVISDGTHFIVYGYTVYAGETMRYEAFVLVLDHTGTLVFDYLSEDNHQEVYGAYVIENTVIFNIQESVMNETQSSLHFHATHFTVFDFNDHSVQTVSFTENLSHVTVVEERLHLHVYTTHPPLYALTHRLDVFHHDVVDGVEAGAIYEGEVSFFLLHHGVLNDEPVTGYHTVDYPGHYTLSYRGDTITFTVEAIVEGVEPYGTYHTVQTVRVPSGYPLLNGNLFSGHEIVDEPGYHRLVVKGLGGYEKHLDFTITSNLIGVFDGHAYRDEVTLQFQGTGFLNHQHVLSGTRIDVPGVYILEIHGVNGYQEVYRFEVVASHESPEIAWIYLGIGVVGGGLLMFAGRLLLQQITRPRPKRSTPR